MKKILLSVAGIVLLLHVNGQQAITTVQPVTIQGTVSGIPAVQSVIDTIDNYLVRATGFYNLNAGPAGYVMGTNNLTTRTGCHYTSVGSAHVTELMVYFASTTIVGNADNITGQVFNCGTDSMPTSLVASGTFNLANIGTGGFPTFIPVNAYPNTSGDIFVAIQYSGIDDSISITSTNPFNADGQGEKRVRQQTLPNFIWVRAYDLWTIGNNPYDADALIIPVVDIASGIENQFTMNGFTMSTPYPSPAQDLITIPFSVNENQEIKMVVYNELGQTVSEINLGQVNGWTNYQMDISGYNNGTYFYVLSGVGGQIASKFIVAK
jgi:Secretion system C-terminal sorting domain